VNIPVTHASNLDQATYWNGSGGLHWTDRQEMQDGLLAPVAERLIEATGVVAGERVVDVGCGCGATTLAVARITGASGRALGVDISAPMIERARQRAAAESSPAEFFVADATIQDFSGERADLMMSRFGVMFFADPPLSFSNMRKALKPGGRLVFACWREPRLNPWLMLPLRAATQHAPGLPKLGPEDPGPFSFADEARVQRILSSAGFSEIALEPVDLELDTAVGLGFENAIASALEIGPASRALEGQPEDVRAAAIKEIRAVLAPFQRGNQVLMGAAIWIVGARG
jgi:ubiquinone/menaquinone biosynthesis C-methylase UbiE